MPSSSAAGRLGVFLIFQLQTEQNDSTNRWMDGWTPSEQTKNRPSERASHPPDRPTPCPPSRKPTKRRSCLHAIDTDVEPKRPLMMA